MINLKEIPVRAIPVVVYLAACSVFGELVIRLPTKTEAQNALAFSMGIFAFVSAVLFFLKLFFDWPRTPGLHIDDGYHYMG